jgi:hypothetical protein
VFRNEHLLHRAGEASEILALTRNREPIDFSVDSRNACRVFATDSKNTVEVYGGSR